MEAGLGQLILNVDDFPPQRYARSAVLRAAGFDVIEAGTGSEALALARDRRPQLVVLDVYLPDLDGLAVCSSLKSDPRTADTLVLHVSAMFRDADARVRALDNGADGYLAEPIEPGELVAHVRSLLRLAKAETEARQARRALEDSSHERERAEQALRVSEERLQEALRVSRSFAFEWDPATDVVRRSESCALLLGLTGNEAVHDTGQRFFQRVHVGDRDRFLATLAGLRPGADSYEVRYRISRSDGRVVVVEETGRADFDASGQIARLIGVTTDVTAREEAEEARRQVEERLREANAQLREADRHKDEFIAVLSHELRNPLAPIRFALPIISGQPLNPAGVRALTVVERQVAHLTRLVEDLLTASRIASGTFDLRLQRVTLQSVVNAGIEGTSPALMAGHEVKVAMADDPIWVQADPARLAQVVTNLLDNSAKYTPQGGEIVLEARREGDRAVVCVRDTGVGIAPDALSRVFDMFWQLPGPEKGQSGLGIGLALVKRLVEMHGGRVEARSAGIGLGAEFVVDLPVAAALSEDVSTDRSSAVAGPTLRVLVVDDNQDLLEMLSVVVEAGGHDVCKASAGAEALSACRAFRPDVVLLDVGLPDMSGLDVARALRRDPEIAGVRLVALTGWGQVEDRRETAAAGFDYHLTKPADPDTLLQLLATLGSQQRSCRTE